MLRFETINLLDALLSYAIASRNREPRQRLGDGRSNGSLIFPSPANRGRLLQAGSTVDTLVFIAQVSDFSCLFPSADAKERRRDQGDGMPSIAEREEQFAKSLGKRFDDLTDEEHEAFGAMIAQGLREATAKEAEKKK